MDDRQKLDRFMEEVTRSTDAKIAAEHEAAAQEAQRILAEAEERGSADAERILGIAKAKISAKYQKQVSQTGYRGKTTLLRRRQALQMQLFSSLRARLTAFTETPAYREWMVSLLKKQQPENDVRILLRAADLPMQEALREAAGCKCSFAQDDSIVIGGLSVVSADGRRCSNHTLDEAFSSQYRGFYRNHKIGEE